MAFSGMGARERGSLDARYYRRTDGTFIELLDEDDMASDDATKAPSQQSVKAYVDGEIAATETYADNAVAAALNWTYATPQNTTSGSEFDFTGIPAGVSEIELVLSEVSLSGTDNLLFQLGDAGGFETTGYNGSCGRASSSTNVTTLSSGFLLLAFAAAVDISGLIRLSRVTSDGLTWVCFGLGGRSASFFPVMAGVKTLSAELTQLRLTRTGSNTFDAGTAYLKYR